MAQATIDTTVAGLQGTPISATPPTVGQILVFNGTAWVPGTSINGPLTASGALTGGSLHTAGAVNANSAAIIAGLTAATVQTPSNGGSLLNGSGYNLVTGRAAAMQSVTGNFVTNNTGMTLYGVAASPGLSITPRTSGLVLFFLVASMNSNGANNTMYYNMIYGSGTPPVQGTLASNLPGAQWVLGSNVAASIGANTSWVPCSLASVIPLNVGQTYWADAMIATNDGTYTAAMGNIARIGMVEL